MRRTKTRQTCNSTQQVALSTERQVSVLQATGFMGIVIFRNCCARSNDDVALAIAPERLEGWQGEI